LRGIPTFAKYCHGLGVTTVSDAFERRRRSFEAEYFSRKEAHLVGKLKQVFERKVDKEKVARLAGKLSKGKRFDMDDFREQLEQMLNMGGLTGLMDKLPGMGQLPQNAKSMMDDREIHRMVAIINSMTLEERRNPALLNGSRRRRIAEGSGTTVTDINRLMKQFLEMKKMMQRVSKKGMRSLFGRMPNPFH